MNEEAQESNPQIESVFEEYPWLRPALGILLIWLIIKYTDILKLVWIFIQIFLLPVFFLWLIGVVSDDIWTAMGQKLQVVKEYVNQSTIKTHRDYQEEVADA